MSAVVAAVESIVESAIDVVGDVVEVVDDIVAPVVEAVEKTVERVLDDPLPVLLSIAGQSVGIPAPVTMAALTAVKGGSIEDIVLSAGTAYLAPQIGGSLTPEISSSLIDAGVDTSLANAASGAISQGLIRGTIAEARGGNFGDGFSSGVIGNVISGGVDAVIDYATAPIGEQFNTTAIDWDARDPESEPVDTSIVGAGIPDNLVSQVSEVGVSTTESNAPVSSETSFANTAPLEINLDNAPKGETVNNFIKAAGEVPPSDEQQVSNIDITEEPLSTETIPQTIPQGALTALQAAAPEAPISENVQTPSLDNQQPAGGLNAIVTKPPEEKEPEAQVRKLPDITKPLIATAGSLFKSALMPTRTPAAPRPVGGLQRVRPAATAAPQRVDVSKLIPIQRATPIAPSKTLPSTAKLTPIGNIASLTSLLKQAG